MRLGRRLLTLGPSASAQWAVGLAVCFSAAGPAYANDLRVLDRFGRVLNTNGLALVDWEGQIANPALEFWVAPPTNAAYPATATLSANGVRLYFDQPSTVGSNGPTKTLSFSSTADRPSFLLSVFPDRDTNSEIYQLTLHLDAGGPTSTVPIRVVDLDRVRSNDFTVTVDFSQDQTGLFADPAKRAIVQQAAADWAYFVGDMHLAQVPAGNEWTFIWATNAFTTGSWQLNDSAYTGFLLYGYGEFTPEMRSGGEPSVNAFQLSNNVALPLRRSGGYEAEVRGNFNTLGWFLTQSDDDWWVTGNLGQETNDLYSIAHHEIGHALFFNPGYPQFDAFKQAGAVDDPAVVAYHDTPPAVDSFDHFSGELDRLSRVGAFGYEYYGDVPRRRWLITKLDLLNAQAVGYPLRPTSAFEALSLAGGALADGMVGQTYSDRLVVAGGIPLYRFELEGGALPPGLELDSFTGTLTGTPTVVGTNQFTIRVSEYDPEAAPDSAVVTVVIAAAPQLRATWLPGGQVLLSWTPPTPGFTLQSTDSLSPPNWVDAPSGTNNPATVPATRPVRFYCLSQP